MASLDPILADHSPVNIDPPVTRFNSPSANSQKFGLYYVLKVETGLKGGGVLTIKYPFTCDFETNQNNLASVNTGKFTIYNLNETIRLSLFKDPFDVNTFRLVEFYAGYFNSKTKILPLVFKGNVKQCYSERVGVDFKTVIECYDGQQAFTSGFTSKSLPAGTNLGSQILELVKDMPNVGSATISDKIQGESKRGITFFGNPAEIVKNLTNADFYVDKLNVYVLDTTDVLIGDLVVINSGSGILDVPKKTETTVTMSIIFEPRLKVSQLIEVDSSVGKIYNGEYKITGIAHNGTISGAVGGGVRTTISMLSMGGAVPIYRVVPDNNSYLGQRVIMGATDV